jgi:hypothetical protein
MSGITYIAIRPTNPNSTPGEARNEALSLVKAFFHTLINYALTLLNAGTGIGKTRMMHSMAESHKGVTFLFSPSEMICQQLLDEFRDLNLLDVRKFTKWQQLFKAIMDALKEGKKPLVYCANIGHKDGGFTSETDRVLSVMGNLRKNGINQLGLIDEFHTVLTSLTGGINSGIYDDTETKRPNYERVKAQEGALSLNLFDQFKNLDVHLVGCSATLNNVISSKLPSIGLRPEQIQILNLYPYKSLYDKLECKSMDTKDFTTIMPFILAAEAQVGKIMLIFACKEDIRTFRQEYKKALCRDMPASVEITGGCDMKKALANVAGAKYVIGIDLLSTGFDLATHAKGETFRLGILFRNFSEKGSQPLASNPKHELNVKWSARLAQVLGRLREGGIFLLPEDYIDTKLYDIHYAVSEAIEKGYGEFETVCQQPEETQLRRYLQEIQLALRHSLRRDDNTKKVLGILAALKAVSGRDFLMDTANPEDWTTTIGLLWEKRFGNPLSQEVLDSHRCTVLCNRMRQVQGHGGSDRLIDLQVTYDVVMRASGRCCHCGHTVPENEAQICHMQAHARDGPHTSDNLGYGHRCCDGALDSGDLLHDPQGGYWRHPRINYMPDRVQMRCINPIHLEDRWNQIQELKSIRGDFRAWLRANEYHRVPSL